MIEDDDADVGEEPEELTNFNHKILVIRTMTYEEESYLDWSQCFAAFLLIFQSDALITLVTTTITNSIPGRCTARIHTEQYSNLL